MATTTALIVSTDAVNLYMVAFFIPLPFMLIVRMFSRFWFF